MAIGTRSSASPIPKVEFPNPTPVWNEPTISAWFSATAFGYAPFGYFRDEFGMVYLRGLLTKTSYTVEALGQNTIFTLPVGYRPIVQHQQYILGSQADKGTFASSLRVQTNGQVSIYVGDVDVRANDLFQLDGVSFRHDV